MVKTGNEPAKNRRRRYTRRMKKRPAYVTRNQVLKIVQKGREKKRLWMEVRDIETNQLQLPNDEKIITFNDNNNQQYSVPNYTILGDNADNRTGAQIQPSRFNFKGYAFINDPDNDNFKYLTHVRVVFGFRNQTALLSTGNSKLQLQGDTTVDLAAAEYQAVLNSFNWKEFQPFYDRTFKVCPLSASGDNEQKQIYAPNYFHINVKHNFGKNAKKVTTNTSEAGVETIAYNEKNIQMIVIARQMSNLGEIGTIPLTIRGMSSFEFYDS